ncbi:aldehyde dehydrogenase [Cryptosporangium aurantiacum]|uniref:Aldehyde dehydrogenase (NAD+) n=1 Tax=Cryptosporangium aurantiacum TaxID=134849 RepID=A0A1M7RKI9_9ACTN|nr:aldehyde dehydrogenase [Cryptosporangium aurantiacum]SHN46660.1 aldehyde dehydrogenase (NAD+) [Cryptosporangium aurantiacum]
MIFIDGAFVEPRTGVTVDVVEAATGKPFDTVTLGGRADVDAAVAAANRALRGPWGQWAPSARAEALDAFGKALRARGQETATLVTRENGMPITLSSVVNGRGAAAIIRYYARLAESLAFEETRPSLAGGRHVVRREPVGVVAAITPWNYPQALAAMKLGPALAAGCTVVLKPPPETALDAFVFASAAVEAGLPPGVINVVPGDRDAGEHLVTHPGVAKVAFTGSTVAGRAIGAAAGRLLRPATLELGGKSASIVLADAPLSAFVAALPAVSLPNNGQTCHACTRILAPRSRYDEIVDAVTSAVRSLVVGDPLEPSTQIGPLVSAAQRDRVLSYVAGASARLTTGGRAVDGPGWFVEPTVFADVDNRSRIAQEEIFGPVLAVIPYGTEDEAVALANDSEYGLGGTVWTADEEHGLAVARRIETGTVGVNHYDLDLAAPFGGVKASGLGRELGPEGLEPYLRLQTIYLG